MKLKRSSGVLLAITSLPSRYGVGDLGPGAYKFADFLARAGQRFWQILPVNPPAHAATHCPYHIASAFAGDPLLISPDLLRRDGLLSRKDIQSPPEFSQTKVDYRRAIAYKTKLLNIAYERFKATPLPADYKRFCRDNSGWLEDYAMFVALRKKFGTGMWYNWPAELRDRKPAALEAAAVKLRRAIDKEKFFQYEFFKQFSALKRYCRRRRIGMIGDMPIYAAYDSADVWANPAVFKLTRTKRPLAVSGVPPDCFCKTGQLWGNPVYNWPALRQTGFAWWLARISQNMTLYDIVRIDHFRGLVAYWEVPAHHKTAAKGKWVKVPKEEFFKKVFRMFPSRPFIVEDLGNITAPVKEFIRKQRLGCMRVLQFGFGGRAVANDHHPANYRKNSAAYTGTHDTNTIMGWLNTEADNRQKRNLFALLEGKPAPAQLHWELIRLVTGSAANLAIIPMQDILGLGQNARMNLPGTTEGNWKWRLAPRQITPAITAKLKQLTKTTNRR